MKYENFSYFWKYKFKWIYTNIFTWPPPNRQRLTSNYLHKYLDRYNIVGSQVILIKEYLLTVILSPLNQAEGSIFLWNLSWMYKKMSIMAGAPTFKSKATIDLFMVARLPVLFPALSLPGISLHWVHHHLPPSHIYCIRFLIWKNPDILKNKLHSCNVMCDTNRFGIERKLFFGNEC